MKIAPAEDVVAVVFQRDDQQWVECNDAFQAGNALAALLSVVLTIPGCPLLVRRRAVDLLGALKTSPRPVALVRLRETGNVTARSSEGGPDGEGA